MIWAVSLIFVLLAYFLVKGLHSRHVARCEYDDRTSQRLPESVKEVSQSDTEFHEQTKAVSEANSAASSTASRAQRLPNEPLPAPHDSPSLLYAGQRNGDANGTAKQSNSAVSTSAVSGAALTSVARTVGDTSDTNNVTTANVSNDAVANSDQPAANAALEHGNDSMDFTAETATLSREEVGTPANASDYENNDSHSTAETETEQVKETHSASVAAATATAAVAGVAVASAASASSSAEKISAEAPNQQIADRPNSESNPSVQHNAVNQSAQQNTEASVQHDTINQPAAQNAEANIQHNAIDLELGDSTYNDAEDLDGDELLDFGDLTADISEMLKELNLREDDSPRLDIDQSEFKQLKTGEPGEVKPEKIENVAGKLRNMLQ